MFRHTGAAAAALRHRIGSLLRSGTGGGAAGPGMDIAVSAAVGAAMAAPPDPSEYGVPDRSHGVRAKAVSLWIFQVFFMVSMNPL